MSLETIFEAINNEIDTLVQVRNLLTGESKPKNKRKYNRTGKRPISKAGRARIAAAQKKRWAAHNKAKQAEKNRAKRVKAVINK